VPTEIALETAHVIALNQLLEAGVEGVARLEVEEALPLVERAMHQKRQDLIANLGGKG
jgi:hypothetical protein